MMFYNARCSQVILASDTMNYIEFGTGKKPLIILQGLNDGLLPVRGKIQAILLALDYKRFARDFKVYMFSRKKHLENDCSTRSMARDLAKAMKMLNITKAAVMGVSQGGMIAQYLAIDYPDLVEKLVLVVTLSSQNETVQNTVKNWIELAQQGNHKQLMIDTAERSYSEAYLRKYRLIYPLLGRVGKPKSYDRFIAQANSCINHASYGELNRIVCPTLVIGGGQDKIVGTSSAAKLAEKINNSELVIYEAFGHALYVEAKDFKDRVLHFLTR